MLIDKKDLITNEEMPGYYNSLFDHWFAEDEYRHDYSVIVPTLMYYKNPLNDVNDHERQYEFAQLKHGEGQHEGHC